MRAVNRPRKPVVLDQAFSSDGLSEFERAQKHYEEQSQKLAKGRKTTSFEFTRYKHADVKDALDSVFHGKCAYCESYYSRTQPVDVEHYRPKNTVEGEIGMSGYWWLAMCFDNLLPSCIDCNRKRGQKVLGDFTDLASFVGQVDFERQVEHKLGKAAAFPLRNSDLRVLRYEDRDKVWLEERLLLDPTRDNPDEHLLFLCNVRQTEPTEMTAAWPLGFDLISLVGAKECEVHSQRDSKVGLTSIQVFGLNRLGLVQARTRVLRTLEFLFEMSVELLVFLEKLDARREQLDEIDPKLLTDLKSRLLQLNSRIMSEIRDMSSERAEYSAVAQSWLKQKIGEL